jgi:hypothetical protein
MTLKRPEKSCGKKVQVKNAHFMSGDFCNMATGFSFFRLKFPMYKIQNISDITDYNKLKKNILRSFTKYLNIKLKYYLIFYHPKFAYYYFQTV